MVGVVIRICEGELSAWAVAAVLRPVTAEWSAVTPAMRRLEQMAGADVAGQCQRLGELPVGSAVITTAGALTAQYMVHVIVRSVDEPVTEGAVRRGLQNGLRRLTEWGIAAVALAPLGTGAGNLDAEESAGIMIPLLLEHLSAGLPPHEIAIVVDSAYERDVFTRQLALHDLPFLDDGSTPRPPPGER